jgi:nucleotide-binding universal stress UspA family protein
MKNILVTIDLEREANLLVESASELAKKFNSKVWLLHVAAPDPDFVGYAAGPQNEVDFRADELKKEFRVIEKYAYQLRAAGIEVEALLVKGQTIETILKKVENLNIDLVIIGHHQHSLFYKTFVGNTDAQLINRSKVPVLLVPLENHLEEASTVEITNAPFAIW